MRAMTTNAATEAPVQDAILIADVSKNKAELIRVQLRQYAGRWYGDIRLHFLQESDDAEEHWLPTKKGISLAADKLPALRDAVDRLIEAAAELPAGTTLRRVG